MLQGTAQENNVTSVNAVMRNNCQRGLVRSSRKDASNSGVFISFSHSFSVETEYVDYVRRGCDVPANREFSFESNLEASQVHSRGLSPVSTTRVDGPS